MDNAEYDFIIKDITAKNICMNSKTAFLSEGTKLGTVVNYCDGESSVHVHLKASMLGYASINLFSKINKFPNTAVRVAIDSMYIDKKYINEVAKFTNPEERWGTWRIKKEQLREYCPSADVPIKDN